MGGVNPFGGAGTPSCGYIDNGKSPAANTGAGGGGGGGTNSSAEAFGGGGAGGWIEAIIVPTAGQVFPYAVGAAGAAGANTGNYGTATAGSAGYIEVMEFYT
jgi:hypothetical protein